MADRSEEKTFLNPNPSQKKPTPEYARDLLGDPTVFEHPLQDLTFEQRISLVLIRNADDVAEIKLRTNENRGRLTKIETFMSNLKFGIVVLGATAGLVLFMLTVIEFIANRGG